ncbi:MAG TPA: ABC transporter ATP-binding protein [Atribacteraceae bacterium]|nr:ABC transporter ATP-binding protein [Atribacteraceae bacterium]
MAQLKIKNLHKNYGEYGEFPALGGINLDVQDGEFVCLLGPIGAGKTTLFRCIAGLESFGEGEILLDDQLVNDLSAGERDVAMVFESYALYPTYSVFDNLSYPLRERGVSKKEIRQRVEEVSEILHITHTLQRKPQTCSGGEMQRIAIGRAIIRRPKIFLFDEPLSQLDAKLRYEMRTELKRIHRDLKQTLLYATPDQLEALSMGERVAVIREGRLMQYDTPQQVYLHPKNLFTAQYVGDPAMNFVEGSVSTLEGLTRIRTSNMKIEEKMKRGRDFPHHRSPFLVEMTVLTLISAVLRIIKVGRFFLR